MEQLRCAIVGGGVHGVYLANRLLETTPLTPSEVAIFDPNEQLLASFRTLADACGMEALRSSYVHHVGTDPFSLESYAEATDREAALVDTVDYPERPTRSLFLDHADHVIERNGIDELHRQVAVTDFSYSGDCTTDSHRPVLLSTEQGQFEAETCILAVGHLGQYSVPEWATGVDRIEHVWGTYDRANRSRQTIVVGGGITAGQLATSIAGRKLTDDADGVERVRLLTRSSIEWETTEAPPPWLNWDRIERALHQYPPGSKERYELVQRIRNDGTMPPYLYDRLDSCRSEGTLTLVEGDVTEARTTDDRVELSLDRGDHLLADRVVLATGFDRPFDTPFIDRIADSLSLVRGTVGMPVLSDKTLAWQRTSGESAPLYVTGALALCTVGPFAPNIVGARRSGDRILPAIETQLHNRPSSAAP